MTVTRPSATRRRTTGRHGAAERPARACGRRAAARTSTCTATPSSSRCWRSSARWSSARSSSSSPTSRRATVARLLLRRTRRHLQQRRGARSPPATSRCSRARSSTPTRCTRNGGVPVFGPISDTLLNATPLILGGLAVGRGVPRRPVQHRRAGPADHGRDLRRLRRLRLAAAAGDPPARRAGRAASLGGALWGGLAGWLKATHRRARGHHHDHAQLRRAVPAGLPARRRTASSGRTPTRRISRTTQASARLPHLFGSDLRVHAGLSSRSLAAVACWWLLTRSTLGFRLRAVGANPFAARTAGMGVERSYLIVMLLSGALAGLAGCVADPRHQHRRSTGDIDAGIGFDAITVALLGRGHAAAARCSPGCCSARSGPAACAWPPTPRHRRRSCRVISR